MTLLSEMLLEKQVTPFQVSIGEESWTAAVEHRNSFFHIHDSLDNLQPPPQMRLVRSRTAPAEVDPKACGGDPGEQEADEEEEPNDSKQVSFRLLTVSATATCWELDELDTPKLHRMQSAFTWGADGTDAYDATVPTPRVSDMPSSVLVSSSEPTKCQSEQPETASELARWKPAIWKSLDLQAREALDGLPLMNAEKILSDIEAKKQGKDPVRRPSRYVIVACERLVRPLTEAAIAATKPSEPIVGPQAAAAVPRAQHRAATTASAAVTLPVLAVDGSTTSTTTTITTLPALAVAVSITTELATADSEAATAAAPRAAERILVEKGSRGHRQCSDLTHAWADEAGCMVM
jgi:hypothetical protein